MCREMWNWRKVCLQVISTGSHTHLSLQVMEQYAFFIRSLNFQGFSYDFVGVWGLLEKQKNVHKQNAWDI